MEKFLFITDLDASLLQHDYSYEEAKPTLQSIRDLGYPLVLNSSKTLAELSVFAEEIHTLAPVIAENGSTVGVRPETGLITPPNAHCIGPYTIINTGPNRQSILSVAHTLRLQHHYQFSGFADWSAEHLAEITGLLPAQAELAKQRHGTEPILWQDSESRLQDFIGKLAEDGIQVVRGGKFIHLMGQVDKADGTQLVIDLYQAAEPDTRWTTVAIGDSENDLLMLERADIAVVIPHDGTIRIRPTNPNTHFAKHNASQGWAEAVQTILDH